MSTANTLPKSHLADIDIYPQLSNIDWTDFHHGQELLGEGRRAAEEALSTILALLEEKRSESAHPHREFLTLSSCWRMLTSENEKRIALFDDQSLTEQG